MSGPGEAEIILFVTLFIVGITLAFMGMISIIEWAFN